MTGLGAYYELCLTCRGIPDPHTGYLLNISELDVLARQHLLPIVQEAFVDTPDIEPAALLRTLFCRYRSILSDGAVALQWRVTPYHCLRIEADDMTRVQLSQQFEFAAAHRLHVPELSDQQNREIFGKCNNANSHGHNYRLEVAVSVPAEPSNEPSPVTLPTLEKVVNETIMQRFDHTNLNRDCPEFASLNPSVENIARVCFDLLDPPLQALGGELHHITVWETPKTCCTVARND